MRRQAADERLKTCHRREADAKLARSRLRKLAAQRLGAVGQKRGQSEARWEPKILHLGCAKSLQFGLS